MSLTILDIIAKAVPALAGLREALVKAKTAAPDLAPILDPKIAALDAVASPEGLRQLGVAVIHELSDPSQFTKDPKGHPSDLA